VRGSREAATMGLVALHAGQASAAARAQVEEAVMALGGGIVAGLLPSVAADSIPVRRAVVQVLGWGRFAEALPRLVDALRDEDIHATTVKAIVAYGEPARAPLTQLAREADAELRGEIFGLLARLPGAAGDATVIGLLTEALEDDDAAAAAAAAQALGEVGARSSLAPLFHALERRHDPEVPHAAAQALARLGKTHPDETRMLVTAHGMAGGETAVLLCRVLAAVGKAEDRPLLLRALKSGDADLRRAAAEAVPALGRADEAREALALSLADEDARVRAAAAEALGVLGDDAATPALLGSMGDEDDGVRMAALRALGALGDPRAAAALRQVARQTDPAAAVFALEALGRLRASDDAAADDALFAESLGRSDPELVKAAVRALAARGGAAATAGLVKALEHARWDVRRLAAQALAGRAGDDERARAALEARAGSEPDPLVREVIDEALRPRA
jgi:HEAT repeat protein